MKTYDFSPAFSRVISSRLDDLLTVCRTCSVTSDPMRRSLQYSFVNQVLYAIEATITAKSLERMGRGGKKE